ncbi:MAG: ATP-dependent helicase [bacterium]|nr:ATP-dependent helicase [Acidimicrobiia bacterium]MCY4651048.1 ATP-dependent helicase [bacterium]
MKSLWLASAGASKYTKYLASVYRRYRKSLSGDDKFDHDDQIFEAIRVLLANPELRKRWQHHCRHLLVDEFQDITPAYLLMLRLLASPEMNVFGVGDDDQTIYGYAGADPSMLIDFDYYFPGAGLLALGTNYRCSKGVVNSASSLLSHNRWRVQKRVSPAPGASGGGFRVLTLQQRNLASGTARRIAGWVEDGVPAKEIAVLSRVNVALLPVMAALESRGVPFHSYFREDMLHQRVFVRTVLAWLRMVRSPHVIMRKDLIDTLRLPNRGLAYKIGRLVPEGAVALGALLDVGSRFGPRMRERWDRFLSDLGLLSGRFKDGDTVGFLDALYHQVGLVQSATETGAGGSEVEHSTHSDDLEALMRTGYIYSQVADFEANLRDLLGGDHRSGVNISSVHRVKGLEWERVVVFGADEGLFPHRLTDDVEEERRVFHVAITRSRRETVVISEKGRVSRFVDEALAGKPPQAATGDLFGDWAQAG